MASQMLHSFLSSAAGAGTNSLKAAGIATAGRVAARFALRNPLLAAAAAAIGYFGYRRYQKNRVTA